MAAGNSVIGALRVVLGAETAQFEDALKSAALKLGFLAGAAGAAGAKIGTAIADGIGQFAAAIPKAINQMEEFNKASQKLGIPVGELSALKYAADLADVSFEALSKGVVKLSKNMVDAAIKPTGEAAKAFQVLGVSVRNSDGSLKSGSVALGDIAEAFKGAEDGAEKTAVAVALFGRAGADMIPFLNMGRDGIKKLNEEAVRFGQVIGSEAAAQAEVFNDNLKRIHANAQGTVNVIAQGILPTLAKLSQIWVDNTTGVGKFSYAINLLNNALNLLVSSGVIVVAIFKTLGTVMSGVIGALGELVKGNFSKALENAQKAAEGVTSEFGNTKRALEAIWKTSTDIFSVWGGEGHSGVVEGQRKLNVGLLAGKNAIDAYLDSLKKKMAAQEAELQTDGLAAGATEALRVRLEGLAIAKANLIPITAALRARLAEAGDAAGLMALQIANMRILTDNNPLVTLSLQINETNAALQRGGLDAETYARLSDQAAKLVSRSWQIASESLASSFESIGQSLSQLSNNWARLAKIGQAIGAAVAFINSYVAATEALKSAVFPLNIAIAAGVLAKGLAMVAAIKSAVVPSGGGFATGGSFIVPGGMGGGDKVRALMNLEPGEQVDVWRPDQNRRDPRGGAAGNVTIKVDGAWRPFMEQLIPQLNAAIADGYTLKLA